MFCKNCGQEKNTNTKFCKYCGQESKVIFKKKKPFVKKHGVFIFALLLLSTLIILSITTDTTETTENSSSEGQSINTERNSNYPEDLSSVVNIFCPSIVSDDESAGGSGTIITDDGLILTNSHIIPQDVENIHVDEIGCLVVLPDPVTGQPKDFYLAEPIVYQGLSDDYDLALLRIYSGYTDEETDYTSPYPRIFPTYLCENSDVTLGERIRVYGYPAISGGYSLTITDGLVSSLPGDGTIYTSAKISHGNSGGLAVDENGCMIGVPSMVSSDENESLGIIYSMDLVNEFADQVAALENSSN